MQDSVYDEVQLFLQSQTKPLTQVCTAPVRSYNVIHHCKLAHVTFNDIMLRQTFIGNAAAFSTPD